MLQERQVVSADLEEEEEQQTQLERNTEVEIYFHCPRCHEDEKPVKIQLPVYNSLASAV